MALRRALPAIFWTALVVTFAVAVMPQPIRVPGDPSDKVLHILAFLMLATLAVAAFPKANLLKMGIGLSAYGALIEMVQAIPALNRHPELLDWAADTAAAAIVLAAAWLVRKRKNA